MIISAKCFFGASQTFSNAFSLLHFPRFTDYKSYVALNADKLKAYKNKLVNEQTMEVCPIFGHHVLTLSFTKYEK